jgi:glutathione S-transferase
MKLYFSAASPYVRKVMASAHHLGLADRIETLASAASPVKRDMTIAASNPLGKVPTAILPDGTVLSDSRTICEWLATQGTDPAYLPAPGPARWAVLGQHALADGLLDAALLARYETAMRPEALRWPDWLAGQMGKIDAAIAGMEDAAGMLGGPVTLGTITTGCALGYLDFRFAHHDWRKAAPRLAAWWARFGETAPMALTRPG